MVWRVVVLADGPPAWQIRCVSANQALGEVRPLVGGATRRA
jgi:hypothetical protein